MNQKLIINKKYNNLKSSLEDIEKYFLDSEMIIHDARNKLKVIEKDGLKLVVKSFKVPNLVNKIVYSFFKDTKAKKSYENGLKLINLNINTPEPVAYIENYQSGLLGKSFFVSICEDYDFTIREVFHHKVENYTEILKQFTHFTYDLHKKGIWHVDYSLGNILITKYGDNYKFSLVDINRMEFKDISAEEGLKNFNKFWAKDDNDLILIAKEYAKLTSFDEQKAIDIVFEEANKVIEFKTKKKKLKKALGK